MVEISDIEMLSSPGYEMHDLAEDMKDIWALKAWIMSALSRQSGLHWEEKVDYNEEAGWQISEISDPSPEHFCSLVTVAWCSVGRQG